MTLSISRQCSISNAVVSPVCCPPLCQQRSSRTQWGHRLQGTDLCWRQLEGKSSRMLHPPLLRASYGWLPSLVEYKKEHFKSGNHRKSVAWSICIAWHYSRASKRHWLSPLGELLSCSQIKFVLLRSCLTAHFEHENRGKCESWVTFVPHRRVVLQGAPELCNATLNTFKPHSWKATLSQKPSCEMIN